MQLKENVQELLSVVAETDDGEGAIVSTGVKGRYVGSEKCRFTIKTSSIAGTKMSVDIVTVINNVDVVVGSFTDVAAVGGESIVIDVCPVNVKVVYTEDAITEWSATVHSMRF